MKAPICIFVDLRGARLDGAHIRGSSFRASSSDETQLQGASFVKATIEVASFDRALLWRAVFNDSSFATLYGAPDWEAKDRGNARWGPKAYAKLQREVNLISQPERRGGALALIKRLCMRSEPDIASCDFSVDIPEKVSLWQSQMEKAGVDEAAYSKALAGIYLDLICFGDGDALAVLRSLASMGIPEDGSEPKPPFSGFLETGPEVKELVKTIMSNKCRVSTLLSDADKALLFAAEKIQLPAADAGEGPPSSTPPQSADP